MKNIFLSIFCLFLLVNVSYGEVETYSVRKSAMDFGPSFSFEIIDGRFSELNAGSFIDKGTNLVVKFGIEEREALGFIPSFTSLTVDLEIKGFTQSGLNPVTFNEQLTISYSPNGGSEEIDLAYFKTGGYHRYTVTVSSLQVPDNVYLEAELSVDRYYDLSMDLPEIGSRTVEYLPGVSNEIVSVYNDGIYTVDNLTATSEWHELEILWDYIEGADEYELEWTWVDNYSATSSQNQLAAGLVDFTERDFELNNTRIITAAQSYRIPLIYSKGFLIYRVRAVGRWTDNALQDTDILKFGPWSTDNSLPLNTVSNYPNYVELADEHESSKNWQYQSVYAEEGKKKEIVSYFDGSLRNRQTVTRINSNHQSIVGESIYDNQGRAAIQILPTPVDNTAIKYYSKLNLSIATNDPYSHNDFDWDALAVPVTQQQTAWLSPLAPQIIIPIQQH